MADTRGQNGTECSRAERPRPRPRPRAGRGRLDSKLPMVSAAAWLVVLAADVGVEGGSSLLVDMMTDVVATLRVVAAAAEQAVDMVVVDAVVVSWPKTGPTGTEASTASDSKGGLGSPSTVGGAPIKCEALAQLAVLDVMTGVTEDVVEYERSSIVSGMDTGTEGGHAAVMTDVGGEGAADGHGISTGVVEGVAVTP